VIKPRALHPGDRIAVVAPSSPFARDAFDRGIDELRSLGFAPVYDERVFDRSGYLAGSPESRRDALTAAWRDPTVGAIVAARGGYGSVQLLPLLDAAAARAARKIFLGCSDTTSLLTFLTGACSLVAFHGPMVAGQLGRGEGGYDRASFLAVLTRPEPAGELTGPGVESLRPGEAAGPLHGGTLTQLVASLGTPFAFDPPPGHVLFVDEVNERPYRLDRMLTQLRLSGLLERAAAMVFGELPACDEPGGQPTARGVIVDRLAGFPGPVLFGFPSGHASRPAITLPFGVRTRVVGGPRPCLVIEEAAVDPD
jgi:muramoyltetrapeptide carboxypeptidase